VEGNVMATTILNLIAVLVWPLALTAAAWIIAVEALAETDEISKVVEALIPTNSIEQEPKHDAVSPGSSLGATANRNRHWIQVHFRRARHIRTNISSVEGAKR
jgi:hypothetical protein